MRNEKWENREMGSKLLRFCFSERSSLPVVTKGHCITVCKLILYKFFTFGSLLAIFWKMLNLWKCHTLLQLYTRSYFEVSSCTCIVMDIHCTYICLTALLLNSMYYSCIYIQQKFLSGYTHLLRKEYKLLCVWGNETILSDKVAIYTGSSSIAVVLPALSLE